MNVWLTLFWIGACVLHCSSRDPIRVKNGALPFMVYFMSRYRGLCMGSLVSRSAVMTAAVCIVNPVSSVRDKRPINVVVGSTYRHPRRGIRVQVTKVFLSKISDQAQLHVSMACAVLLLKRKVPDALVEIPLRPVSVNYHGDEKLMYQEDCLVAGWHFFHKGDKIYPPEKFLLQRSLRAQFVVIARMSLWCQALLFKYNKALMNLGYISGMISNEDACVRDPDRRAQPCHGMYGAPLICRGAMFGMMMAPDAQWSNCTGYSNIFHLLSNTHLRDFMDCISRLFKVEEPTTWEQMKKAITNEGPDEYDIVPSLYDNMIANSHTSDERLP